MHSANDSQIEIVAIGTFVPGSIASSIVICILFENEMISRSIFLAQQRVEADRESGVYDRLLDDLPTIKELEDELHDCLQTLERADWRIASDQFVCLAFKAQKFKPCRPFVASHYAFYTGDDGEGARNWWGVTFSANDESLGAVRISLLAYFYAAVAQGNIGHFFQAGYMVAQIFVNWFCFSQKELAIFYLFQLQCINWEGRHKKVLKSLEEQSERNGGVLFSRGAVDEASIAFVCCGDVSKWNAWLECVFRSHPSLVLHGRIAMYFAVGGAWQKLKLLYQLLVAVRNRGDRRIFLARLMERRHAFGIAARCWNSVARDENCESDLRQVASRNGAICMGKATFDWSQCLSLPLEVRSAGYLNMSSNARFATALMDAGFPQEVIIAALTTAEPAEKMAALQISAETGLSLGDDGWTDLAIEAWLHGEDELALEALQHVNNESIVRSLLLEIDPGDTEIE